MAVGDAYLGIDVSRTIELAMPQFGMDIAVDELK